MVVILMHARAFMKGIYNIYSYIQYVSPLYCSLSGYCFHTQNLYMASNDLSVGPCIKFFVFMLDIQLYVLPEKDESNNHVDNHNFC